MKATSNKVNRPHFLRCMNPNCPSRGKAEAKLRGLCGACYKSLERIMKAADLDWPDMVRLGKCRDRKAVGSDRFPDLPQQIRKMQRSI